MRVDHELPRTRHCDHCGDLLLGDHRRRVVRMHVAPVAVAGNVDLDVVDAVARREPRLPGEFGRAVAGDGEADAPRQFEVVGVEVAEIPRRRDFLARGADAGARKHAAVDRVPHRHVEPRLRRCSAVEAGEAAFHQHLRVPERDQHVILRLDRHHRVHRPYVVERYMTMRLGEARHHRVPGAVDHGDVGARLLKAPRRHCRPGGATLRDDRGNAVFLDIDRRPERLDPGAVDHRRVYQRNGRHLHLLRYPRRAGVSKRPQRFSTLPLNRPRLKAEPGRKATCDPTGHETGPGVRIAPAQYPLLPQALSPVLWTYGNTRGIAGGNRGRAENRHLAESDVRSRQPATLSLRFDGAGAAGWGIEQSLARPLTGAHAPPSW